MSTSVQRQLAGRLPAARPASITEHEWAILVAHVDAGMTFRAISERLGVQYATVRTIAYRAMKQLWKELPRNGRGGPVRSSIAPLRGPADTAGIVDALDAAWANVAPRRSGVVAEQAIEIAPEPPRLPEALLPVVQLIEQQQDEIERLRRLVASCLRWDDHFVQRPGRERCEIAQHDQAAPAAFRIEYRHEGRTVVFDLSNDLEDARARLSKRASVTRSQRLPGRLLLIEQTTGDIVAKLGN